MSRMSLFSMVAVCMILISCNSEDHRKEEKPSSASEPKGLIGTYISDIVPLADGGAYAYGFGGSIWYLRGNEAVLVKEVDRFSAAPTFDKLTKEERALWAMLQRERSKRKRSQAEVEELSDQLRSTAEDDYDYDQ